MNMDLCTLYKLSCCMRYVYYFKVFDFLSAFRTHNFSALKVVKSAVEYTESALDEIRMLKGVSVVHKKHRT